MYVTLALVGLGYKEIGNMSSNMILITDGITPKYLLQPTYWSAEIPDTYNGWHPLTFWHSLKLGHSFVS